jgi:pSer/pThr/pTyr-binding forkhead associated (FHA) protein/tetratricopeptide (TPR) repeat protein
VKLSVLKNNLPVKDYNLSQMITGEEKGPFSFFAGRSPECQILLDSREVSRIQAEFTYGDGIWSLKNTSPQIPIFVNGGSSILVGPFRLIVHEIQIPKAAEEVKPPEEASSETVTQEVASEESPDASTGDFSLGGQTPTETVPPEPATSPEAPLEPALEAPAEVANVEEKTADIPFIKFELELEGKSAPFGTFIIDKDETFIGRDEKKCQIILKDSEVSAVHAVIRKKHYSCEIEDLNSKNGIVFNGKRINKIAFESGDKFSIGTTNFIVRAYTEFLDQESARLMPVEENQEIEVEKIVEESASFGDKAVAEGATPGKEGEAVPGEKKKFSLKQFIQDIKTDPVKKKRAMMIGGVLILAILMIDTTPEKPKVATKKAEEVTDKAKKGVDEKLKKFTPEQLDFLDSAYLLSKELFKQGKYAETIFELQKIFTLTPDYKNAKQINSLAKSGLAKMEELERKRLEEIERKRRDQRIKEMVEKATEAVKNKESELAKGLFGQILKLDPENYEVTQLKLEIESWEAEEKRKKEEEETKRVEREKRVEQLSPGKKYFLAQDWYKAIIRLNEFLEIPSMDEDLIKEATDMLKESKENLSGIVNPILEKAETLKEGGDSKGAYEEFKKALMFDPSLEKPLEEMKKISEKLQFRAGKVYREAIIAESLSLFQDAKEKFLEVQQISPSDGEYYEKAVQKLKNYIDYQ